MIRGYVPYDTPSVWCNTEDTPMMHKCAVHCKHVLFFQNDTSHIT